MEMPAFDNLVVTVSFAWSLLKHHKDDFGFISEVSM